jgi:acetyl coenzyme A synthetase (ADP forming)-like protein
MQNLGSFFDPESVAVIGASRTPGKLGYAILENLKLSFKGKIFPINPNATEILGLTAYPSVTNVKEPIEQAIIVIPSEMVEKALSECIKKRIKSCIIITSGFSEIGKKDLEESLKKLLNKGNIRVMGPNCIGIYKKDLDMIFFPRNRLKRPPEGHISFITQSGAFGSVLLDIVSNEGVGVSKFISIGNKIDVNEIELMKFLGDDVDTRCITMYLESLANGEEFIKVAKEVVAKKPVVVFKAGITQKGAEAVVSHTGALAGSAEIFSAAMKQSGIIEAKDSEEIFDYAKALANQPVMKDNHIAIITDGGGFGVVATDKAVQLGLELPKLEDSTVNKLKTFLPTYASTKNPVDLTGDATDERYKSTIDVVLKDKNISGAVIIALMQLPTLTDEFVNILRDAKVHGKPITICSAGGGYVLDRNRKLESFGIPVYPTPERAIKGIWALYEYGKIIKRFERGKPPKVVKK